LSFAAISKQQVFIIIRVSEYFSADKKSTPAERSS